MFYVFLFVFLFIITHIKTTRTIKCGQVEELIMQAESELSLIPKMAEWKAWEPNPVQPPKGQFE